ncbi:MAG: putative acid--amine ligase YjfC [Alphaproteobacteria bacterium MarineAlpha11_Bin1]|nr:MAG: putative acid--amine ligase YjfC [Alphaproteobacteria bacterium MarineAlpha11_Bin1]|tara:strand:- start:3056 stop:4216 length:1161 start_codon:yes stop_codon:yes gene_type:complete
MDRIPVEPRENWRETAEAHGFRFHSPEDEAYWDERLYYRFTMDQIEGDLEDPTEEIEQLCFEVVERALSDETIMKRLQIPEEFWDFVANSWRNQERNLYGRLDFAYDGRNPAKLFEYNADTPTSLYESAIFQWVWLEQAVELNLIPDGSDQFNSLHEALTQAWSKMVINGTLHLACCKDSDEDQGTVEYLADCARQSGLETRLIYIEDIGVNGEGRFTDLQDNLIENLFKLYPWEWLMSEEFGQHIPKSGVRFVEPGWKAILSNKGLLPLLWEMFEGHPNLLPAYFEGDPAASALDGNFVRKPLFSREGANVEIFRDGDRIISVDGDYGAEGHIIQALHPLPDFDGNYPMIGSWLVASKACGICIREDTTLITGDDARFVPHIISD